MAAHVADSFLRCFDDTVAFINSHFDDNIKSLAKIKEVTKDVKDQKDAIEKRLSQVTKEVPAEIKKAITTAESVTSEIAKLGEEQENLQHEVLDLVHDLQPMGEELNRMTSQLYELEKHSKYLAFIARVEELSSEMQSCLLTESLQPALESFHSLTALYDELQDSKCKHLLSFMTDTILFWNQILRDRVANEFEEVLKAMRWPIVPTTMKTPPVSNAGELKTRLGKLFKRLLHLQLPDSVSMETLPSNPLLQKIPGMRPLLLPLQLMIKPLKKRFRYHFYGKRRTNSIDKPEWYFTQVLNWIRDHWDFLAQNIQPLLDETEYKETCANTEFMRGMVMLVMEKLADDLPRLLYNDVVFSHTVDEVLLFDRELRSTHGYSPTLAGCLDLLITPEALSKWLAVEKKFAVEKVERMLESPTAWESQYKDIVDVDEVKVPECTESFMTLLCTITDRYKPLPDPVAKVQFLGLQLELLEDFRIRLVQVMKDAAPAPTAHTHTAVLNAVHYIVQVLKEWSEMVFFLQIQYFRTNHTRLMHENSRGSHEKKRSMSSCTSPTKSGIPSPVNNRKSSEVSDLENLPPLDTTVFQDIVDLFESIMKDMLKNIVNYVFTDVQARSQPYRKDRWLALSSQKDIASALGLSASACEMLLVLKDHLCLVNQRLSRPLFTTFWQRLAARLNSFIFTEVILANHFSEGGAMQLQFDMTRNLFPLFGEYTQKPESYFKEVREACTLLTLKTGSAILLKETIYCALHKPNEDTNAQQTDPRAALRDVGVFTLTPEQAETLLSLRTNLSVT